MARKNRAGAGWGREGAGLQSSFPSASTHKAPPGLPTSSRHLEGLTPWRGGRVKSREVHGSRRASSGVPGPNPRPAVRLGCALQEEERPVRGLDVQGTPA